ncbi:MAG: lactonase family protein [Planctomycetaceae bacterium]|nr:lactonase family protein [Planctomycetaceae bacterium]
MAMARLTLCLLLGVAAMHLAGELPMAAANEYRVFVGTYSEGDSISKGIYTCLFNAETGTLTEPSLAVETVNPSFLAIHPNHQFLYAVNELSSGDGAVTAFKINSDGTLTRLNEQSSLGGAPCHCNVDATGQTLLIANYSGGNVVTYPIGADGQIGEAASNIHHSDPARKNVELHPRAHSINISSDNRFAYAADLGLDKIFIYKLDAAHSKISPARPASAGVAVGGGPRHFAIHPSGSFAYTNNETTLVATAFARNPKTGALKVIQDITTIPGGFEGTRSTAECLCHPSGKFLYISNRGPDSIAVYSINEQSGLLTWVENESTGGKTPRNFFIEPAGKWLLAENQDSDSILVFSIDQATGALNPTGDSIKVGKPVCIRMLPLNN